MNAHFTPRTLLAAALSAAVASPALAQLRIVSWNPNGGPRPGADTVLEAIGDDTVNGIAQPIDILFLQEQNAFENFQYAELLNDIYNTDRYEIGFFVGATTSSGTGGVSTVYNTETVELISQTQATGASSSGAPRAPVENRFRPLGYDAAADVYAYNSHYKAGTSGSDQARRLTEATAIRTLSDSRGQGTHAIYLGDFNMRASTEAAYQELLSSGNGQAFDPLNSPGNWNNNFSFRFIHTQSPAQSGAGLTTGGVDDRFDFQLTSAEVLDGEGFDLIPGSYRAFGNDGQSFNTAINVDRVGREYPLFVLDALATAGDHLPVVVDYQLPASQDVSVDPIPTQVIVGANVNVGVQVLNDAPTNNINGADELDFTVSTTGDATGGFSGSANAASAAVNGSVSLNTASAGAKSGAINANTTSQGARNSAVSTPIAYTVLNSAQGSFDAAIVDNTLVIDFGTIPQNPGGTASESFTLFNLPGAFTAGLDLLGASSANPGPFSADFTTLANLAAGASQSLGFNLDLTNAGTFSSTFTLDLADHAAILGANDLPDLTVQLLATVGDPVLLGDANDDGVVDLLDFDILASNFNTNTANGASDGDFNGDGTVDLLDFDILAQNFGATSPSTVPEPASAALLTLAVPALLRRRR